MFIFYVTYFTRLKSFIYFTCNLYRTLVQVSFNSEWFFFISKVSHIHMIPMLKERLKRNHPLFAYYFKRGISSNIQISSFAFKIRLIIFVVVVFWHQGLLKEQWLLEMNKIPQCNCIPNLFTQILLVWFMETG